MVELSPQGFLAFPVNTRQLAKLPSLGDVELNCSVKDSKLRLGNPVFQESF